MKIIIGLGNLGPDYTGTRHNLGFMALDRLAEGEFIDKTKFRAQISELTSAKDKTLLVKPTGFYNLSGETYRAIVDFYKVDPSDVLIVHDELALPLGTIRTRQGGTPAGNNGIKSINEHGGEQTARIRVGIANPNRKNIDDTSFVLGKFSQEERTVLDEILLPKIEELIMSFVENRHMVTSYKLHTHELDDSADNDDR